MIEAEGVIKLLKLSEFSDHLVVLSKFDGKEKGVLFDADELKVKDGIGSVFDFSGEFLFARDLKDSKRLVMISLKNY